MGKVISLHGKLLNDLFFNRYGVFPQHWVRWFFLHILLLYKERDRQTIAVRFADPFVVMASAHLAEQLVREFKQRDTMYLCITPEGSRSRRKKWKKGFLVIAKAAGVPVYLGRIDYQTKTCQIGPLFHPTDDMEADMAYIMSTYHGVHAKHPERFSCGE